MGETQIDLNKPGGTHEEFQAFISTGRTGRRNAIPDILTNKDNNAENAINVVHLAQQLQSLKTSINDGQVPSTSKAADLTESLTQPTPNAMKAGR